MPRAGFCPPLWGSRPTVQLRRVVILTRRWPVEAGAAGVEYQVGCAHVLYGLTMTSSRNVCPEVTAKITKIVARFAVFAAGSRRASALGTSQWAHSIPDPVVWSPLAGDPIVPGQQSGLYNPLVLAT
jgi:hypothetical protein